MKAPVLECLFNKVAELHAYNFIENKTPTQVNIANFLRTAILKKICESLLLSVSRSGYLSENTPKRLLKSNFAQIFIYTICFKDNNF